ncbi:pyrroline-5-carboxylate reductase [Bacillus dakarensis]|uniref:pyrroline-5-carboxylate reductase n=1 Tax=Robertmurraya dakarensis TaxID=1926278 RepID=UPI0009822842|nr:pyrroline-5-carboxylate reductase [Bacillus dakarensis]
MTKLTFIGAGSMAEALLSGMIQKELFDKNQIWLTNRSNKQKLTELQNQYGVNISYDQKELLEHADMVILAMKPKDVVSAFDQIKPYLTDKTMIVSLLAGVSISSIEYLAEKQVPIVRAMPNTSAAIGQSATAVATNSKVSDEQLERIRNMFDTVGLTTFVEEKQIDAVTGLSGSGPAYIYYIVEAMEKSAAEIGLERELAQELIVQTLIGAAQMVSKSNKAPEQLRKEVTSPGGTTEAGINTLESYGVQEAFVNCIKEATAQSKRLGTALSEEITKSKENIASH